LPASSRLCSCLGVLLLTASAACSRSQGAPSQAAAPGGAPGGQGVAGRALRVRVAPVVAQDVVYDIKAVGSLEAEELVQVTAEVEGAVADVRFHEGDRVGPGSVLARIDPERFRLDAQRASAAYLKAQAEQRRAAADLARREKLAQEELVSEEELNRAKGENERLSAEAASSKALYDMALQNQQRSQVRPKAAGMINTRSIETGQFVKSGHIIATLVDLSRLRLRFKVSEGESLRARTGQAVTFRVGALGATDFTAAIYHVGGVADPATRQVEVMAWVQNPGVLKPGFFAEVSLASETRKGATVVPEAAVQASERGFVAYVVENEKARLTPVSVGLRTGTGVVEILSGLTPGQTVVVEGSDRLADGVPVQAVAGAASGSGAAGPERAGTAPAAAPSAAAPTGGSR
jgi:membrane fusion protein, multidrug efflux system